MVDRKFVYRNQIKVSPDDFKAAANGHKTCTIRLGTAGVASAKIDITDGQHRLGVFIRRVDTSKSFGQLGIEEAIGEGFETTEQLRVDLMRYYRNLREDQPMTVIWFEIDNN